MNVYDPDNLASAVTLNRVLEETCALTPALYFLPRRATVDTWIETSDRRKMFIPKGTPTPTRCVACEPVRGVLGKSGYRLRR